MDEQAAIDRCGADAARRTGTPAQDWQPDCEPVTWGDTSLGHPQPGQEYAEVLTPGYRILLSAGGRTLEYHTGGTAIVYCGG